MITMKLSKLAAIPVIGLTAGLGPRCLRVKHPGTCRDRDRVTPAGHPRGHDPGRSSTGTARTGHDRVCARTRSRACAH